MSKKAEGLTKAQSRLEEDVNIVALNIMTWRALKSRCREELVAMGSRGLPGNRSGLEKAVANIVALNMGRKRTM